MSEITLTPEFITEKGKPRFVVLPYKEFLAVQEALEDYRDLRDLRAAKAREAKKPGISLKEAKALLTEP